MNNLYPEPHVVEELDKRTAFIREILNNINNKMIKIN